MSTHSSFASRQISPTETRSLRTDDVRSNPDTRPPLLTECRDCSGAGLRTHDHPGDPWARTFQCETCEGAGEVVAGCECCRDDAVEFFDGSFLCEQHAAEARADALLASAP
jgi:hypothetical protein